MLLQENLTQEVATLKADNGELRAKLEESRQQLQSNEQMIRWLNQQVGLQSPTTVTLTATWKELLLLLPVMHSSPQLAGPHMLLIMLHCRVLHWICMYWCTHTRRRHNLWPTAGSVLLDSLCSARLSGLCRQPHHLHCEHLCCLQVTDAQLQVSAVPGSRFKFWPSQLAGSGAAAAAATPSRSAGSYGVAGRPLSPAGVGLGLSATSKLATTSSKHHPHTTLSFGAYSPQTVTPKQDYMLPPQPAAVSTSKRL